MCTSKILSKGTILLDTNHEIACIITDVVPEKYHCCKLMTEETEFWESEKALMSRRYEVLGNIFDLTDDLKEDINAFCENPADMSSDAGYTCEKKITNECPKCRQ